jgi:hypothetical protein
MLLSFILRTDFNSVQACSRPLQILIKLVSFLIDSFLYLMKSMTSVHSLISLEADWIDSMKNKSIYFERVFEQDIYTYFSPCSVSFVLIGEYIQYSPLINFRLIIPSNILLQCLCSTKNEKKQHHEGNMALRIIYILTHACINATSQCEK